MAPIDKTWSDTAPPPLPRYPPATETDGAETARWLLVSFAGRAAVQIGRRCVVGSGPSCDLCLIEWGISPHHALLTVEDGELYITSLSDAPTLIDGAVLNGRLRLAADSVVTFGDIDFAVQVQVPEAPRDRAPLGPAPADQLPPRPDPGVRGEAEPSTAGPSTSETPRRNLAPIALGIAVPLALFALWFYRADQWPAQLDLLTENAEAPAATMPSDASATIAASVTIPETALAQPAPESAPAVTPTPQPSLAAAQVTPQPDPVAAPVSPAPDPVDAPLSPSADDAVVQATVLRNAVTAPAAQETAVGPPRADPGPPLVLAIQAPLVDVAHLQSVDSRVKPPWSDQPPIVVDVAQPSLPAERDAIAESAPATSAPSEATPPAILETIAPPLRAAAGPPLIFPVSPPRVAVAQFQAVDGRVKPPWSDRPPIVAYADAPALIFPVRPALFDIRAFETADARVRPPWSDIAPSVAGAGAEGAAQAAAVAALLFEAGRLYGQGDLVTPAHQNAAELYVRVLTLAPKTRVARTRLNNIVGWIARDAGDALLEHRVENARQILAQLASAVPKSRRSSIDVVPVRRWRVVELLVDADALMREGRISGPAKPNAVALLREALRIDPQNTVAGEMLSKASALIADAQRR